MTNVKKMSVKEFRELGFLQEVNRLFLHPMGLALEIVVDDVTGDVSFGRVWDYRDDPEGIYYDEDYLQDEAAIKRARYVDALAESKVNARMKLFGSPIQLIRLPDGTDL